MENTNNFVLSNNDNTISYTIRPLNLLIDLSLYSKLYVTFSSTVNTETNVINIYPSKTTFTNSAVLCNFYSFTGNVKKWNMIYLV